MDKNDLTYEVAWDIEYQIDEMRMEVLKERERSKEKENCSRKILSRNLNLPILLSYIRKNKINFKTVRGWEKSYPSIDIRTEIRKAISWIEANPSKRKKNYKRFLVNWFGRASNGWGKSYTNGMSEIKSEFTLKGLNE